MYGRADGNALSAQRLYQKRLPGRRVPNNHLFASTYGRISEHGNVSYREPADRDEQYLHEVVIDEFEVYPTKSIRQVTRQFNLSTWMVWNILKKKKNKYSLHYTLVQGLKGLLRRLNFCRVILNVDIEDGLFLKSILSTDE